MRGKTHAVVGVATALFVTQVSGIDNIGIAVTAGMIGGLFPDVDCKNSNGSKILKAVVAGTAVIGLVTAALSNLISGISLEEFVSYKPFIGFIGLLVLAIVGTRQSHRMFTHSIEFIAATGFFAFMFGNTFGVALVAGEISHVILDLFNKKDVKLSILFNVKACFNLCKSDGAFSNFLTALGTLVIVAYPVLVNFI